MSEILYYKDAYLREFEASIVSATEEGSSWIGLRSILAEGGNPATAAPCCAATKQR